MPRLKTEIIKIEIKKEMPKRRNSTSNILEKRRYGKIRNKIQCNLNIKDELLKIPNISLNNNIYINRLRPRGIDNKTVNSKKDTVVPSNVVISIKDNTKETKKKTKSSQATITKDPLRCDPCNEFLQLAYHHFRCEKELKDYLKNPTPRCSFPILHTEKVEKMERIKQERIKHLMAKFDYEIEEESEQLQIYNELYKTLKKRRKKTASDLNELQNLETSILEVKNCILELQTIKQYQVERQQKVKYTL